MRAEWNLRHRLGRTLALALLLLAASPTFSQELTVLAASGEAKLRLDNFWQTPHAGMIVTLPAVVSTGANGSVRLQQGETLIAVAANTAIELLSNPDGGPLLQRVVQESGSAFYDIAPQGKSRFRVEASYLVAVVKGTEFNVTSTSDTSTVALFEGHLRIDAPEVGDSVEIFTGEIARRHRDDSRITVLSMADGNVIERADTARSDDSDDGNDEAPDDNLIPGTIPGGGTLVDVGTSPGDSTNIDVDVGADADVDLGNGAVDAGVEAEADVGVDLGNGAVDAGADVGLNAGDVVVDAELDAGADLDAGTVDLDVDAGLDAGDVVVDAELDVGTDLDAGTVDFDVDAGLDAGDVVVDAGLDAGADLGAGTVDLDVDAGLDAADVVVDAGLDAGASPDGGAIDLDLDAGLDAGDVAVDAGLDAGADLDEGSVDLVGDAAGVSADTDIDLGSGAVVDAGIADVDVSLDLDLGLTGDTDSGIVDVDLDTDDGDAADADAGAEPSDPGGSFELPDLGGLLGG